MRYTVNENVTLNGTHIVEKFMKRMAFSITWKFDTRQWLNETYSLKRMMNETQTN